MGRVGVCDPGRMAVRPQAISLQLMNSPIPLIIRPLSAADFTLVWHIFRTIITASDTYALSPDTTFEEARDWGWQTVHDPGMLPAVLSRWQTPHALGTPCVLVFCGAGTSIE